MTNSNEVSSRTFRSLGIAAAFVVAICFATATPASAQTFTVLVRLNGTNGTSPGTLVQGIDGNLYGTAYYGGSTNCTWGYGGCGTVFKMTPSGTLTTLYQFCTQAGCADGASPSGLVLATDGNFYGITTNGGSNICTGNFGNGCGTVFKITAAGKLTTLYSFCVQAPCTDGQKPISIMQAADGNFYGGTIDGGARGYGVIFKVTAAGKLTNLHSFVSTDGDTPWGTLVQSSDGTFYGTTVYGGTNSAGTVFKITSSGTLTMLHSFTLAEGGWPYGNLVQATDGNFYGTASGIGNKNPGTVFKVTPAGILTTLYTFCSQANCTDGEVPQAGLVQATDGNFYGVTLNGGDPACIAQGRSGCGTVFEITPGGTLTTLHSLENSDGYWPKSTLLQHTNGNFYGTTQNGGPGNGTVFSLDMGLGPFVSLLRNPSRVGQIFGVLGQGLAGTSSVSFNGTPASFKVLKDTLLTATVPAGATTVPITVTTPGGVLTSNTTFRVIPQIQTFNPTSGPVGTVVTITGISLTQTTQVSFGNQVPASFTVISDRKVTATVPSGAVTGPIAIQTPGGTAVSSAVFTVTQ